ncbi:PREDICTED: vesicle-associated membrane protein 4-like [Amphimedon queenslandica]|uniref:V-SNARE coiled-coil homology domain-containing protein n=1 Tax=Amphimedon queenslandica TaxID=400682 RepID=A0A1X7UN25_AMPQE|nr:PREDICTED: vesicle-associated membrane protein 4-like [Amphimedon queenslandica]|eukprot:XP_003387304.1 PREDICTED: vesicle-associated membrane protein 4-like [Amphimedon queenslandica]
MPPKFKRGQRGGQDRVQLLGLDSSDEEEEEIFVNSSPHVPHSSRTHSQYAQDPKIRQVQNQVTGVISTMKDNITKVLERGDKLEDLEEKSGELAESASQFRVSSRRLERKMWWKNCKLKLILGGIVGIILLIIIVIVVVKTQNK